MRRFIPFSLAVVLAACTTEGSTTTSTSSAPQTTPAVTETTEAPAPSPSTTAEGGSIVAIIDYSFAPPTLTIQVGDTVTWRNDGTLPHTSTSVDNWNSGAITPGSSFDQTFDVAGTFEYVCNFHSSRMAGTITVEG